MILFTEGVQSKVNMSTSSVPKNNKLTYLIQQRLRAVLILLCMPL